MFSQQLLEEGGKSGLFRCVQTDLLFIGNLLVAARGVEWSVWGGGLVPEDHGPPVLVFSVVL